MNRFLPAARGNRNHTGAVFPVAARPMMYLPGLEAKPGLQKPGECLRNGHLALPSSCLMLSLGGQYGQFYVGSTRQICFLGLTRLFYNIRTWNKIEQLHFPSLSPGRICLSTSHRTQQTRQRDRQNCVTNSYKYPMEPFPSRICFSGCGEIAREMFLTIFYESLHHRLPKNRFTKWPPCNKNNTQIPLQRTWESRHTALK